ncbi:hypothetical protein BH20ACI1_BH20ACI1_18470 [soil metagenome]
MKNLITICCAVSLLIFVGLACKNNPLAKFTNQYHCTIEGEPKPQTADDYFKRDGKHMADNNYSAAYNQCAFDAVSEGLKLDPQNANGFAVRGFLYEARAKEEVEKNDLKAAKNDFEAALEDLNEAIRLAPDNSLYYDTRGSIYKESGFLDPDSDKTLQDLSKAIELSSSERLTALLFVRRGDIYFNEKKDYENAVKDYTEAINLDPKNEEFYSKRSQAYYKLGKEDLSTADDMKVFQLKDEKEGKDNKKTTDESSNDGKIPKTISGGVLNGKAVELPKPVYPAAARAVKASGAVNVQVTVDENGNVTGANAVSGHPLLRQSAVAAAREAKFKPTLLSGKLVKVTGVIVYNFVT